MHTEAYFHCSCKITLFAKIYKSSSLKTYISFLVTKSSSKIYQQKSTVWTKLNPSTGFWKFADLSKICHHICCCFRTLKKKKKKKWTKNPCKFGCVFLVWVPLLRLHCFKIRKSRIFQGKFALILGKGGLCCFWFWIVVKSLFKKIHLHCRQIFSNRLIFVNLFFCPRQALNAWFSVLWFWVQPCKNSYNPGFGDLKVGCKEP